jgi:fatty acid hydroxylase domain-containing protein 2
LTSSINNSNPFTFDFRNSHPVENLISNMWPIFGVFQFLDCHATTYILWISVSIVTTLTDHSGHHLPFLHSSEFHDFHHLQ